MNFIKPTAEQIEKILQSDKSFRFLHDNRGMIYSLQKVAEDEYKVSWDTGSSSYPKASAEISLDGYWTIAEEDLAQLEDTSKRHRHYDLIKQYIEDPNSYDVYSGDELVSVPAWFEGGNYRLEKKKPKVKKYKVLFKIGNEYEVSGDYYKDEEEFKSVTSYKFIQLIQESEKEF